VKSAKFQKVDENKSLRFTLCGVDCLRLFIYKRLQTLTELNKQEQSYAFFMQENQEIYIAQLIDKHLKDNGRSVTWLCDKLNWQRKKWYRFMQTNFIDVNDLQQISIHLNHDFFLYYSSSLKK